jgi:hypothetical protein
MIGSLVLSLVIFGSKLGSDFCCKCEQSPEQSSAIICLSKKEMRAQVNHIEPLQLSGLDRHINIFGDVEIEVRFGPEGKVECVRTISGHPIAKSATVVSIKKWTFKPLILNGMPKSGCGRITIKYHLREKGSSTELK